MRFTIGRKLFALSAVAVISERSTDPVRRCVVMTRPGLEPGTYGLKVRCSTN